MSIKIFTTTARTTASSTGRTKRSPCLTASPAPTEAPSALAAAIGRATRQGMITSPCKRAERREIRCEVDHFGVARGARTRLAEERHEGDDQHRADPRSEEAVVEAERESHGPERRHRPWSRARSSHLFAPERPGSSARPNDDDDGRQKQHDDDGSERFGAYVEERLRPHGDPASPHGRQSGTPGVIDAAPGPDCVLVRIPLVGPRRRCPSRRRGAALAVVVVWPRGRRWSFRRRQVPGRSTMGDGGPGFFSRDHRPVVAFVARLRQRQSGPRIRPFAASQQCLWRRLSSLADGGAALLLYGNTRPAR